MTRPTLCVVSPCFNEAAGIRAFYAALKAVLVSLDGLDHRIVLVDDGSTDATLALLDELAAADERVRVYSLSRNFGHQIALTAGCDVAEGDVLVLMDSDLQHPPALIPAMVERWRAGAEVVSAVRLRTADASLFKRVSARAFYRLLNAISETRIVPDAADFVLLAPPAFEALRRMPERHRFLRGMVSWIGFRREFVEYQAPARGAGESSYTVRNMIRLASDALFSFSTAPVRLATRLGLAVVACGMLYLGYILYTLRAYPGRIVQGWSSLIIVVLILSGVQIVFIGLIGEYIARIFEESKGRPLYLFKRQPPGEARGVRSDPARAPDPR
ncbi:MAG TPA: glycosyltransferase family 2 protein [Candidatus Eisenbacteria bacterium]|jgi:dolichol-phosphate mannosyltransferase